MKQGLIFLAGIGIGGVVGWFASKKYYERRLDAELEEMKNYYKNDISASDEEKPVVHHPSKPSMDELRRKYVSDDETELPFDIQEDEVEEMFEHPVDSDEDDDIDGYSKEEWDSIGYEQQEDEKRRAKLSPSIIDVEEYGELPNFDATELIYRQDDDILEDEEGNEIEDRRSLLGDCMDGDFENDSNDDLFVRNFRLATDYHIHKVY